MTDTNELRRLAQAATPGPWHFWRGWVAADIDSDGGIIIAERPTPSGGKYQARVDGNFRFIAAANPAAITELLDRLEAAESDAVEQARLNGMGASREAALMAKLEAAEKDRDALRAENEALATNLRGKHSITGATYAHLIAERDALRARIEAMEKQEPVAWWNGKETAWFEHELCGWQAPDGCAIPLYPAPISAEAAVLAEREACAEVCDRFAENEAGFVAEDCAAEIRARDEK